MDTDGQYSIEQTGGYQIGDIIAHHFFQNDEELIITKFTEVGKDNKYIGIWSGDRHLTATHKKPKLLKSISSDLRVGDKVRSSLSKTDGTLTKIWWGPVSQVLVGDIDGDGKGWHLDQLIKVNEEKKMKSKFKVGDRLGLRGGSTGNKEWIVKAINDRGYVDTDGVGTAGNFRQQNPDQFVLLSSVEHQFKVGDVLCLNTMTDIRTTVTKVHDDGSIDTKGQDGGRFRNQSASSYKLVSHEENQFKVGDQVQLVGNNSWGKRTITAISDRGLVDVLTPEKRQFYGQSPKKYELVSAQRPVGEPIAGISNDKCKYFHKAITSSHTRVYRGKMGGDSTQPLTEQFASINKHAVRAALQSMREVPVCNMSGKLVEVRADTKLCTLKCGSSGCNDANTTVYFKCTECK